jgi:N-acetyl-beta-hexosaminidase
MTTVQGSASAEAAYYFAPIAMIDKNAGTSEQLVMEMCDRRVKDIADDYDTREDRGRMTSFWEVFRRNRHMYTTEARAVIDAEIKRRMNPKFTNLGRVSLSTGCTPDAQRVYVYAPTYAQEEESNIGAIMLADLYRQNPSAGQRAQLMIVFAVLAFVTKCKRTPPAVEHAKYGGYVVIRMNINDEIAAHDAGATHALRAIIDVMRANASALARDAVLAEYGPSGKYMRSARVYDQSHLDEASVLRI